MRVKLDGMRLERARQWGACWLGLELWGWLALDAFWGTRLVRSRKGTEWLHVLKTLSVYRLLDPGSEWRLHRQWFDRSAMGDLLGEDIAIVQPDTLYRCLDKLLEHKQALFSHLRNRWETLFGASFEVLLYDLTSTYFECDVPEADGLRRFGYSRDKRSDCVQVVIALIVTPQGFPLAYEVMAGNTAECTTLEGFVEKIQAQYGRAERVWVMDRGIPTEAVLERLRAADVSVRYLVGTPKGRLTALEQAFLDQPWVQARERVQVKLLEDKGELYVLAHSEQRVDKERAMRRRALRGLLKRLTELRAQKLVRDALLMKLGAAKKQAGRAYALVDIELAPKGQRARTQSFNFTLNRAKLRTVRRREGRYLLRTNLTEHDLNRSPYDGRHEGEALSTGGRFGRLRRTGNRPAVDNAVVLIAMLLLRSVGEWLRASAARIWPATGFPTRSVDVRCCSSQCTRLTPAVPRRGSGSVPRGRIRPSPCHWLIPSAHCPSSRPCGSWTR